MQDRRNGKTAIVVGTGRAPGDTFGRGCATTLLIAREGAEVLCVDRDLVRARQTVSLIAREGDRAVPLGADVSRHNTGEPAIVTATTRWPRIDIPHNNMGAGRRLAGGWDRDALDQPMAANLKAIWLTIETVRPALKAKTPARS